MDILKYYEKALKNKLTFNEVMGLWDYDVYDLLYLAYNIKKNVFIRKCNCINNDSLNNHTSNNHTSNNSNSNNYTNYGKSQNYIPSIDLCSIINVKSGKCSENCIFCSQSIHNKVNIDTYELKSKNEILKHAKYIEKYSNRFSIVVSGKTVDDDEFEKILDILEEISKKTNLKLCASLGLLNKYQLYELKELNVRIHNNLETSKEYFEKICTTHSYNDKVKMIKLAKKIGLEVCSGGIFGLGESRKDRISMLMELKNLSVDSVALNIIHPIEGTKLNELILNNKIQKITPMEALKSIAISKILLPNKEIRLCGGREHNLKDLQVLALMAIDGLMVGNYLTTRGRCIEDDILMIKNLEM